MKEEIPLKLPELCSLILNQENVKVINPEYFYNSNEGVYMNILEVWFYCVFAIKQGVYSNIYNDNYEENMDL